MLFRSCEPKRRHLQKSEKWVQNGYIVFRRFYEIHQKNTKPKSYDDFCSSAYYNAFVKFGSSSNKSLTPTPFLDLARLQNCKNGDTPWASRIFNA